MAFSSSSLCFIYSFCLNFPRAFFWEVGQRGWEEEEEGEGEGEAVWSERIIIQNDYTGGAQKLFLRLWVLSLFHLSFSISSCLTIISLVFISPSFIYAEAQKLKRRRRRRRIAHDFTLVKPIKCIFMNMPIWFFMLVNFITCQRI